MFRNWFRGSLAWLFGGIGFSSGQDIWQPFVDLPGDPDSNQFVVFYGGLGARATETMLPKAEALQANWRGPKPFVRLVNLRYHTGAYEHFCRSRFWHWLSGLRRDILDAAAESGCRKVVLVGNSTGALAVLFAAIWFRLAPTAFEGVQIERVVLMAPPFRLWGRRNSLMLTTAGVLYYIAGPLSFLVMGLLVPSLAVFCVPGMVLHYYVVPRLTIPNGEERYLREKAGRRLGLNCFRGFGLRHSEAVVLSLIALAYVLAPVGLWALLAYDSRWLAAAWLLYLALLLLPPGLMLLGLAGDGREPRKSRGYFWLPVVTAVSLVHFQCLMRPLYRLVDLPVLVFLAGNDVVVDNSYAKLLCQKREWQCVEFAGCAHSQWPADADAAFGREAALFAQNTSGVEDIQPRAAEA